MRWLGAGVAILTLGFASCSSGNPADQAGSQPQSSTVVEDAAPSTVTSTSTSTSRSATEPAEATSTSVTEKPDVLDEAFLAETANRVQVVDGSFMIVLINADGTTLRASIGADSAGNEPAATDVFRVGSITKVFTALATLTLVDEGLVDLDAPATDYVTRVSIPRQVTVRHLLGHRSGITDAVGTAGFIPQLLVDQDRVWTPEEQMALIADNPSISPPGIAYSYSNSNFVILGVLIEEVTGRPYHEVVRSRITDPLAMTSTYLAGFEQGTDPFDPYTNPSVTDEGEAYNYTSIASAAWAAGGMVSSALDLHALFTALVDGQLISTQLVEEMTSGSQYGLGVELRDLADGLIGHEGGIPGYSTFVRHSLNSGTTAFFALTDDGANPFPARRPILDAMAAADQE